MHSAFCILHSAFCILHSAFCILHSAFCILHSAFCILHSAFCILHSAFCILHSAFCILHSAFCILHSAFCILHSAFCILHSAFCILHSAFCILRSAFCILHYNEGRGTFMNILAIGDIVGSLGCEAIRKHLPALKKLKAIDLVIANGENSADGNGITPSSAENLFTSGVDIITTGNHVFRRKEVYETLDRNPFLIRPANYPP